MCFVNFIYIQFYRRIYICIKIYICFSFLINFSFFFFYVYCYVFCVLRCVCFLCVCWLLVELVRKKPKCRLTASQHSEGSFFSRLARSSPKRNMQMSVRQRTHTDTHTYKITLSHSLDSTVSLREQRVFISATWAHGVKEREREKAQKVYVAIALQWPHID